MDPVTNSLEGLQAAQPMPTAPAPTTPTYPPLRWMDPQQSPDQTVTAGMRILQRALAGLHELMDPGINSNPPIPSLQLPKSQTEFAGNPL